MTDTHIQPGTAEWLEKRYQCITGTDVAKILGLDSNCSRKRLLELKVLRQDAMEKASSKTKELVSLGNTFEIAAQESFLSLHPEWVGFKPSLHQSAIYDCLCGSPDYLVIPEQVVVEFKTHFFPRPSEARPLATMPLKHYIQVQAYLEIMEYETGRLYSWTINNGATEFHVTRDRQFFREYAMPQVMMFMDVLEAVVATTERLAINKEVALRDFSKTYRQISAEKTQNVRVTSNSMDNHVIRTK